MGYQPYLKLDFARFSGTFYCIQFPVDCRTSFCLDVLRVSKRIGRSALSGAIAVIVMVLEISPVTRLIGNRLSYKSGSSCCRRRSENVRMPHQWAWFVRTDSVPPDASRCCMRLASIRKDSKVASGANRVDHLLFLVCYRFWLETTNGRGFDCRCGCFEPSSLLDYPMAEF